MNKYIDNNLGIAMCDVGPKAFESLCLIIHNVLIVTATTVTFLSPSTRFHVTSQCSLLVYKNTWDLFPFYGLFLSFLPIADPRAAADCTGHCGTVLLATLMLCKTAFVRSPEFTVHDIHPFTSDASGVLRHGCIYLRIKLFFSDVCSCIWAVYRLNRIFSVRMQTFTVQGRSCVQGRAWLVTAAALLNSWLVKASARSTLTEVLRRPYTLSVYCYYYFCYYYYYSLFSFKPNTLV